MPTVNLSAIAGDSTPVTLKAEDLGSGSADNVSGKVLAVHNHDAIYKAAWDSLYGVGLTKNYVANAFSTSGDNTVVAAPGSGNRISVAYLRIANESATETTVLIKSGASTNRFRMVLAPKDTYGAAVEMEFPVHFPLDMANNQALVVNLSGANSVGVNIGYFVRS